MIQQLRPHIAGKTFGLNGGQDGRDMENLRCLGEQHHVIEQSLAVDVGNAKGHLRLKIDKDDGAVLRV